MKGKFLQQINSQIIFNLKPLTETLEQQQQQTQQQNIKICEILAEHKVLLNQLVDKNKAIDTVMQIFPLTSESQLHELDNLLTSQKDLYVSNYHIIENINFNIT